MNIEILKSVARDEVQAAVDAISGASKLTAEESESIAQATGALVELAFAAYTLPTEERMVAERRAALYMAGLQNIAVAKGIDVEAAARESAKRVVRRSIMFGWTLLTVI